MRRFPFPYNGAAEIKYLDEQNYFAHGLWHSVQDEIFVALDDPYSYSLSNDKFEAQGVAHFYVKQSWYIKNAVFSIKYEQTEKNFNVLEVTVKEDRQ